MSKKTDVELEVVKINMVRRAITAARKRDDAGNYISAVKEARTRFDCGLKKAKDFVDWVKSRNDEHPADLAEQWCLDCWDIFPCTHSDKAIAANGEKLVSPQADLACNFCHDKLPLGDKTALVFGVGLCSECASSKVICAKVKESMVEAGIAKAIAKSELTPVAPTGKIDLRGQAILNAAGEVLGMADARNCWHPV
jgi:hypothetical protein